MATVQLQKNNSWSLILSTNQAHHLHTYALNTKKKQSTVLTDIITIVLNDMSIMPQLYNLSNSET